jgi:hypothetical protein
MNYQLIKISLGMATLAALPAFAMEKENPSQSWIEWLWGTPVKKNNVIKQDDVAKQISFKNFEEELFEAYLSENSVEIRKLYDSFNHIEEKDLPLLKQSPLTYFVLLPADIDAILGKFLITKEKIRSQILKVFAKFH